MYIIFGCPDLAHLLYRLADKQTLKVMTLLKPDQPNHLHNLGSQKGLKYYEYMFLNYLQQGSIKFMSVYL